MELKKFLRICAQEPLWKRQSVKWNKEFPMVSLKTLTLTGALLLAGGGMASAADLSIPMSGLAPPTAEQPVEWGSGWYLRGDLGFSRDTTPPLNLDMSTSTKSKNSGWQSGLAVGYKVNNWFRVDAGLEYVNPLHMTTTSTNISCQVGASPIYNATGVVTGSSKVLSNCYGVQNMSQTRWNALVNGYVDLGTWSGITPYIGAGIGINRQVTAGNIRYFYTGGTVGYAPTWTDPFTLVAYAPNWNANYTPKTHTNMAWALMGGVAIDVSEHTKLDVGLRYLNMGKATATDTTTGALITKTMSQTSVKVGFRYMID